LGITEGHTSNGTLLKKFCGQSLDEVVYTRGHEVLVEISGSAELGYLRAVYQVHSKGYAHTFSNKNLKQLPSIWKISIPIHPTDSTYVNGFFHLTWFFTKPPIKCTPHCYYSYDIIYTHNYGLSIENFTCHTQRSVLYVHDGVSATITGSRHSFACNHQYKYIPLMRKHKFTRVDLHLDVLDPEIIFVLKQKVSKTSQKVKNTQLKGKQALSFKISPYDYDKPLIYESTDSHLSVTVTGFSYRGPQHNVMAYKLHPQLVKRIRARQGKSVNCRH
jgi:hypothetical protein